MNGAFWTLFALFFKTKTIFLELRSSVGPVISNTTLFSGPKSPKQTEFYSKKPDFYKNQFWQGIFKHLHNIQILLSRLLTIYKDAFKEMRPGSVWKHAPIKHVCQSGAIKSVRLKLSFWKQKLIEVFVVRHNLFAKTSHGTSIRSLGVTTRSRSGFFLLRGNTEICKRTRTWQNHTQLDKNFD